MYNQPNAPFLAASSPRGSDMTSFMSQLQTMSNKELQALLEDDAKIDDMVLRSNEVCYQPFLRRIKQNWIGMN